MNLKKSKDRLIGVLEYDTIILKDFRNERCKPM